MKKSIFLLSLPPSIPVSKLHRGLSDRRLEAGLPTVTILQVEEEGGRG